MHTGNPAEAIEHLEQRNACYRRAFPLGLCWLWYWSEILIWQSAQRVLEEATALTPRTPEDKLFLGSAIAIFKPADGLEIDGMKR